jgi:hypothetical protein
MASCFSNTQETLNSSLKQFQGSPSKVLCDGILLSIWPVHTALFRAWTPSSQSTVLQALFVCFCTAYSFIIPGLSSCLLLQLSLSSLFPRHTCTCDFSPLLLLIQYTNQPFQEPNQGTISFALIGPGSPYRRLSPSHWLSHSSFLAWTSLYYTWFSTHSLICFLPASCFILEGGGGMFLQNIRPSPNYTALQLRRQHIS